MDTATIWAIVIGGLGFALGVCNFVYWGWWTRREMVKVREQKVEVSLVRENTSAPPYYIETKRIFLRATFKLVRSGGEDDLYLESAYLTLDKALCQELDQYFDMPHEGKIYWNGEYRGIEGGWDRWLRKREPVPVVISDTCSPKEALSNLEKELHCARTEEQLKHKQTMLGDIKGKVKKLDAKYKICWIDSQGKQWPYRFPRKWWHKFIPKRLLRG